MVMITRFPLFWSALYNYGSDDTALFTFPAGGTKWQEVWDSGKGNWAETVDY